MRRLLFGLTFFALAFASYVVGQAPEEQFTVDRDVQYCTGGGKPLLMDVLIPRHRVANPTPVVLWIHGGGWMKGDKNTHANAKFLADAGFVAATLNYRPSGDAPFPAAVEDCKCAVRFLRANAAQYGIDPYRIGVAGSSAGGHLAEMLATADHSAGLEGDGGWPEVSSKIEAAASYFGPSDLTQPFPQDTVPVIVKFLGGTEQEKPELYRKASPIFYVAKNDPPLLLVHGEDDVDVLYDQSLLMEKAYRRDGLTVEFISVKNAGHDFEHKGDGPITPSLETIHQKTVDFFKRYLVSSTTARNEH